MIHTGLILNAVLFCSAPAPAAEVTWEASPVFVVGQPYPAKVTFKGGPVELWKLETSGFEVNGQPLAPHASEATVAVDGTLTVEHDLAALLPQSGTFQLGFAGGPKTIDVLAAKAATRGELKFLDMTPEQLAKYRALLITNRGPILVELWPDVAPNHVRNFLDLCDSGFYEGVLFHRVSPSFMIQGGDPYTRDKPYDRQSWGVGNGPRRVPAEFSDRKHVAGVLSAARGPDVNSASSQFFIMTATSTGLDGQYSAFGKVLQGMEAVTAIANAKGEASPRDGTIKPFDPQRIEHTFVLITE